MTTKDPKSPCCGVEMAHEPDNIHWHYYCPRCGNEFEIDGITERIYDHKRKREK